MPNDPSLLALAAGLHRSPFELESKGQDASVSGAKRDQISPPRNGDQPASPAAKQSVQHAGESPRPRGSPSSDCKHEVIVLSALDASLNAEDALDRPAGRQQFANATIDLGTIGSTGALKGRLAAIAEACEAGNQKPGLVILPKWVSDTRPFAESLTKIDAPVQLTVPRESIKKLNATGLGTLDVHVQLNGTRLNDLVIKVDYLGHLILSGPRSDLRGSWKKSHSKNSDSLTIPGNSRPTKSQASRFEPPKDLHQRMLVVPSDRDVRKATDRLIAAVDRLVPLKNGQDAALREEVLADIFSQTVMSAHLGRPQWRPARPAAKGLPAVEAEPAAQLVNLRSGYPVDKSAQPPAVREKLLHMRDTGLVMDLTQFPADLLELSGLNHSEGARAFFLLAQECSGHQVNAVLWPNHVSDVQRMVYHLLSNNTTQQTYVEIGLQPGVLDARKLTRKPGEVMKGELEIQIQLRDTPGRVEACTVLAPGVCTVLPSGPIHGPVRLAIAQNAPALDFVYPSKSQTILRYPNGLLCRPEGDMPEKALPAKSAVPQAASPESSGARPGVKPRPMQKLVIHPFVPAPQSSRRADSAIWEEIANSHIMEELALRDLLLKKAQSKQLDASAAKLGEDFNASYRKLEEWHDVPADLPPAEALARFSQLTSDTKSERVDRLQAKGADHFDWTEATAILWHSLQGEYPATRDELAARNQALQTLTAPLRRLTYWREHVQYALHLLKPANERDAGKELRAEECAKRLREEPMWKHIATLPEKASQKFIDAKQAQSYNAAIASRNFVFADDKGFKTFAAYAVLHDYFGAENLSPQARALLNAVLEAGEALYDRETALIAVDRAVGELYATRFLLEVSKPPSKPDESKAAPVGESKAQPKGAAEDSESDNEEYERGEDIGPPKPPPRDDKSKVTGASGLKQAQTEPIEWSAHAAQIDEQAKAGNSAAHAVWRQFRRDILDLPNGATIHQIQLRSVLRQALRGKLSDVLRAEITRVIESEGIAKATETDIVEKIEKHLAAAFDLKRVQKYEADKEAAEKAKAAEEASRKAAEDAALMADL